MVNPLPAVLIGGPPHAGKSVLFYGLTQALRERGVRHHAIRACPDGEGNWYQEGDPETVSRIRLPLHGEWPDAFVKRICPDLEHRCLPFLVDMGGQPRESQYCILRECTHSVLLLRADKEEYTQLWRRLVAENGLLPLAQISSKLKGISAITSQSPLLEGTITGLGRYDTKAAKGPVFNALVKRIEDLFNAYSLDELQAVALKQAPTEHVIDLSAALRAYTSSTRWESEMLRPFLDSIPTHASLSIYGVGPNWLYAALAAHVDAQSLYLYDPKHQFGWLQPLRIRIGTEHSPEDHIETRPYQDITVLSISFPYKRLEYFQPDILAFPPVASEKGLIIDGPIPNWLLTALVRLYKEAGVAWIAPYYVQENKAVIVYSRVEAYHPGDLIPMPGFWSNLVQF